MARTITKPLHKAGAVEELEWATSKEGHINYRDKSMAHNFGIRVSLNTKSWTFWGGPKGNPVKIGRWPDLSYAQAKAKAEEWLNAENPGYRRLTVEGAIEKTIAELKLPHGKKGLPARPKTLLHYEALKKSLADWKDKPIEAITKDMVAAMHKEIGKKGQVQADNMMRVLSAVMNAQGIEPNPVRILNRKVGGWFNTKKRGTSIESGKLPALYKGLLAIPNDLGRDMLLVCLYTGLRSVEARTLTWDRVDLKAKTLTIPAEIAKNGQTLVLPLTKQVRAILATRRKLNEANYEDGDARLAYVFPNGRQDGKKPYMNNAAFFYKQARDHVRKAIKDETFSFTTHALRHTFVTAAAQARLPFERTQYLVNHTPATITSLYTHLKVEDLRKDAQKVADHIDATCKVSKATFGSLFKA